jgi:hypothetical protein
VAFVGMVWMCACKKYSYLKHLAATRDNRNQSCEIGSHLAEIWSLLVSREWGIRFLIFGHSQGSETIQVTPDS